MHVWMEEGSVQRARENAANTASTRSKPYDAAAREMGFQHRCELLYKLCVASRFTQKAFTSMWGGEWTLRIASGLDGKSFWSSVSTAVSSTAGLPVSAGPPPCSCLFSCGDKGLSVLRRAYPS